MRGSSRVVVPALFVIVAAAAGQEPPARPHNARIEALVDEARDAPPEFSADILIRAAQSPAVTDAAWRRELLEEAFMRAYGAQQSYRRIAVPLSPDTRQGAEALASDTPLNRVALQVRAVQLLRFTALDRARELFGWIEPNLDADTCDSALAPGLDEYYVALAALARQAGSAGGSQERTGALSFFELFLWRARIPSEVPSVIQAIRRFHANASEAVHLEALLRALLENGELAPRAFSTSEVDIVSQMSALRDANRALGLGGTHLLSTLRQYLVAQLRGSRCSDSTTDDAVVEWFNAVVRREGSEREGVAPISSADARPSRRLGAVTLSPYWTTPEARRLHDDAGRLRGTGRVPLSLALRRSRDWLEQADRHLVDVQQWQATREASVRDHFYQKASLFTGLLDLVPPSPTRVRVLRAFTDFLHHEDAAGQRALWYLFANRLIERIESEDSRELLQAIGDSGDRVLLLYAHAARTVPANRRAATAGSPGDR
jgi:hypothetical protein